MKRYLCIHGHFYQPPRENPWIDETEPEGSAHPYRDWNERITAECYGPNTAARIVSSSREILDIRNNYAKISFNFGPTLLSWMERHRPEIYANILAADRQSALERGGHGNAIAQGYNHLIMPLATRREKELQVLWGMEDFRSRFRRDPEGFWLPEAAVDLESLDIIARAGIKYVVLAPRQARAFRVLDNGSANWQACDGGSIDPTRPYVCALPSGRSIVIFVYDGPISQSVAFEGVLNDGSRFARRLADGFDDNRAWNQLVNIATDGESYGHHHPHGDMALAYALHLIESQRIARLTNYGEFLAHNSPTAEVQLWENSSWSCVHGVERWRSDCGCRAGGAGWHQRWRGPLREAYRRLADRAVRIFEERAPSLFKDSRAALDRYIEVILDREKTAAFLEHHLIDSFSPDKRIRGLRLLEMMRNAQLMFTSCAWFFDEVSGLEGVQTMKYAARVVQLGAPYAPTMEQEFIEVLERAPSNIHEIKTGAEAYRRYAKPNTIDLRTVVANHALLNFDQSVEGRHRFLNCEITESDSVLGSFGSARIKLSRVEARSLMDGESISCTVCVLHFGGHDFQCAIRESVPFSEYETLQNDLIHTFERRSLTELVRRIDTHFGTRFHSIQNLLTENRRELLRRVTTEGFRRFDSTLTSLYEENRKLFGYLVEVGAPLPGGFLAAADFVLTGRLFRQLDHFLESGDADDALDTAVELNRLGLRPHDPEIRRRILNYTRLVFRRLVAQPTAESCRAALQLLNVIQALKLDVDLWEAETITFALLHGRPLLGHLPVNGGTGRPQAEIDRLPLLKDIAERLRVSLRPLAVEAILEPSTSSVMATNSPTAPVASASTSTTSAELGGIEARSASSLVMR